MKIGYAFALHNKVHRPKGKVSNSSGSYEHQSPASPLLRRMAEKIVYEKVVTKPKEYWGDRARGHPPCKLTDAQIIEMRHRHENECWTMARCAEHYGVKLGHARSILQYMVRSRLFA